MARPKFTPGISYVHKGLQPFCINVYLDGRLVGTIRRETRNDYFYKPRGGHLRSPTFTSIEAVKASIERRE